MDRKEQQFASIKSIISDCICRVLWFHNVKTTETILNMLSNEYTDKIITALKAEEVSKDDIKNIILFGTDASRVFDGGEDMYEVDIDDVAQILKDKFEFLRRE